MELHAKTGALAKHATECLIVGVFENQVLSADAKVLDDASEGYLSHFLKTTGDLTGKAGESALLYSISGVKAERILLVGCGKAEGLDVSQYKTVVQKTWSALQGLKLKGVTCQLPRLSVKERDLYWTARLLLEGFAYSAYRFEQHKTTPAAKTPVIETLTCVVDSKAHTSTIALANRHASAINHATALYRDLANTPPNICNPRYLAEQAQSLAKKHSSISAEIYNEAQLQKLGLNTLLAVGQGSANESHLIVLSYQGPKVRKNTPPITLVGKGVTFDTGGICIKSSGPMLVAMKMDMSGAACMLSTLQAVAELELPLHIKVVIPTAENMVSGTSYRPSDIIKTLSGKTVEVIDTDAEGRLILCDALTFAERFKPEVIVDVATLTGAIITSLGHHLSGLFGNDQALVDELLKAGTQSTDRAWQLPLDPEYNKQLDSKIADLKNLGDKGAGSITAACYLSRFTEGQRWAHLDVAGTAMVDGASTGRPVGLLVQYLLNRV